MEKQKVAQSMGCPKFLSKKLMWFCYQNKKFNRKVLCLASALEEVKRCLNKKKC
ncbi:MAG: hypothetical protein ACI4F9_05970 [Lachnospiraceae bacterium]